MDYKKVCKSLIFLNASEEGDCPVAHRSPLRAAVQY